MDCANVNSRLAMSTVFASVNVAIAPWFVAICQSPISVTTAEPHQGPGAQEQKQQHPESRTAPVALSSQQPTPTTPSTQHQPSPGHQTLGTKPAPATPH